MGGSFYFKVEIWKFFQPPLQINNDRSLSFNLSDALISKIPYLHNFSHIRLYYLLYVISFEILKFPWRPHEPTLHRIQLNDLCQLRKNFSF